MGPFSSSSPTWRCICVEHAGCRWLPCFLNPPPEITRAELLFPFPPSCTPSCGASWHLSSGSLALHGPCCSVTPQQVTGAQHVYLTKAASSFLSFFQRHCHFTPPQCLGSLLFSPISTPMAPLESVTAFLLSLTLPSGCHLDFLTHAPPANPSYIILKRQFCQEFSQW